MDFHSRSLLFIVVKYNETRILSKQNFPQAMHKLCCLSKIFPSYQLTERLIFHLC